MARKTVGYVGLEWVCPNCSVKNPGKVRICTSCGAAQPKNVTFYAPDRQDLITDKEEIEKVRVGADVHCPYCGTRNTADATTCIQCSAELTGAEKRQAGAVLGSLQTGPVKQVACPHCGHANPDNAQTCSNCGGFLAAKPATLKPPAQPPAGRMKISPLLILLILGMVVLCIIGIIGFANMNRSETMLGEVQSVSWTRSIAVEGITLASFADWADQIPSDAEIGRCEQRYHHSESEYVPGSREVCGTPYVVDTGTGAGEVVQDCSYEVYQEYCEYSAYTWTVLNYATISGSDNYPSWPDPQLASEQRLGDQKEEYQVNFWVDGENYTYKTTNESLFNQLTPGSTWNLSINGYGQIVDISN